MAEVSGIFDLEEFKLYKSRWDRRQQTFETRRAYYSGEVYQWDRMLPRFKWLAPRLYKGVKPLYLPLSRAVDVDAGIIPAGWAFGDGAPREQTAARDRLWAWSKWRTRGVLYVHYGAMFGVSGLKVADLRRQKRVIVAPLSPETFMLVREGLYDDTPSMAIRVEKRDGVGGASFEYAEVTTPETIRTFKDGVPTGFDGRQPEYPNDLKFVPFVEVNHLEVGSELGEATFVKAVPLLDEVNQLASYLADIIGKHAEPQWVVAGAEASGLVKSGDNVWFLPSGGEVTPVVPDVDIAGVFAFLQEIAKNVKEALPETSFDELRRKDQIATATLELQLMELVLKVKRVRPNYDEGLAEGLRMAGRAAKEMGVAELAALDDDGLALDDERPVLPLDPETALDIALKKKSLGVDLPVLLREMGFEVSDAADGPVSVENRR